MKEFSDYLKESDESDSVRIFQDMDGCLTDFDDYFRKFNPEHLSSEEYENKYGTNAKWPIIDKYGAEYWENMPWTSDGKKLWSYIEKYNPTILSAASRNPSSREGKIMWIKKNLTLSNYDLQTKAKHGWDGKSRIILNPDKWRYATGPKDILIDDTPNKINAWRSAGGTGILYISADRAIEELKKLNL